MENKSIKCLKCGNPLKCLICDEQKNLDVYNLHKINSKVFGTIFGITILLLIVVSILFNSEYSEGQARTDMIFFVGLILGEIIGGIALIWKKN